MTPGPAGERLDAVEELVRNADLRATGLEGLKGLPDLERLVCGALPTTDLGASFFFVQYMPALGEKHGILQF